MDGAILRSSWNRVFTFTTVGLCIFAMTLNANNMTLRSEQAEVKAKELQVLFLGNSQIYYNDLPRILEALAASAPADRPRIRTERVVPGGASLASHWNAGEKKGTARARIKEKRWDYVVIQEIFHAKPDTFNQHATLFHDLIDKNDAKTVLFSTASISQLYPKGFSELHDMQATLGKKLKVSVAAGGNAWLSYWGEMPTQDERLALYDPDKAHPGKKGSYLYACVLYAALTGQTPIGLTNRIPGQPADTITEREAKRFQESAWQVHRKVNGSVNR